MCCYSCQIFESLSNIVHIHAIYVDYYSLVYPIRIIIFPVGYSLFPIGYSLFPTGYSLLPVWYADLKKRMDESKAYIECGPDALKEFQSVVEHWYQ